ncbi:hypothetical protein Leryth_025303 [Lithospermum erythrorhizon]|nr:hypothetical protein Leryth_025303 [Lithospermum erythrorhizon]
MTKPKPKVTGWEPILDIEPKFSRNKVCEFYANIVNKQDESQQSFETMVNGMRINVDSKSLSSVFEFYAL